MTRFKFTAKSSGDFTSIFREFEYKEYKLYCIIKIKPRRIKRDSQEDQRIYNWLTRANLDEIEMKVKKICREYKTEELGQMNAKFLVDTSIMVEALAVKPTLNIPEQLVDTALFVKSLTLQITVEHTRRLYLHSLDELFKNGKRSGRSRSLPRERTIYSRVQSPKEHMRSASASCIIGLDSNPDTDSDDEAEYPKYLKKGCLDLQDYSEDDEE